MTQHTPKGLLGIWTDVDPEQRVKCQKWHNCEHMTERVSIPGFHVGRRYCGIEDAPDFFMYYETERPEVMADIPYSDAINNPTPWSQKMIPHLKNTVRAIYGLNLSAGEKAPTEAPYMFMVRFNCASESRDQMIEWFEKEYMQSAMRIPGIYRTLFYEMEVNVSNIPTAERKIHGGGPGEQQYLVIYELAALDNLNPVEWKKHIEATKVGKNMLEKWQDVQPESYWLDFTMYAPKK